MAVPVVALLALIGLFATADVQSLLQLRDFDQTSQSVDELVTVRARLQTERHVALLGLDQTTERTNIDIRTLTRVMEQHGLATVKDEVVSDLDIARQLAEANRSTQAQVAYNDLIDRFGAAINNQLDDAPIGLALQRSNALQALLASEEAFLREDIAARASTVSIIELTRLHTSASEALGRYSQNATTERADALEALTVSSSWRTLTLMRSASFGGGDATFDVERWAPSAKVRRLTFHVLALEETTALQTDLAEAVNAEARRLTILAGIVILVLAIATFGTLRLRRSIVGPLSNLTLNARRLKKGELAPIDDPATDEIAEVAHAFSSLASTMEHLWTDIDAVSTAVAARDYDRRIDTEQLEGDWLRLATTMNETLTTGEAHRDAVNEELDRRVVMSEISNTAVLAQSAPELTAAVLRHLPQVLPGSHAHLHEHPSGAPHVDLGVQLEPSISALEVPTLTDNAQRIELRDGAGVASLVEFPHGPPAVLVLRFGNTEPAQIEPLVSLMETAGQILAQAHRRQAAETRATHDREHDVLTGLPNSTHLRRWFAARSDHDTWSAIGVQPKRLDEWDGVFGRNARDLVLNAYATRLSAQLNTTANELGVDAAIARISEPDFILLVPTSTAPHFIEAITASASEPLAVDGARVNVDVTLGVVDRLEPADRDLTQTMANISAAVRQADGRATQVITFEPRHRDEVRRRTELTNWLANAIDNRDLFVHFQPVVNATTTTIEGYELLVRGSRNGKPVSPAEFVPIAEETNMIVSIGEFVLREACAALPFLRGDSPYVAINLSPIELSDDGLLDRIARVLHESQAERNRVVFEVTEGATTTEDDVELLKKIRALGVKIAIDDFGSGQSNLSYLNTLPAQILKLDRSLVTPMVDDVGASSVVRKAIEMAHDLGMSVVGEGVETNEELNALRRMRCDRIQGWLTGRPGPLEDFIEITIDRPVTRINMPRNNR